MTLDPITQRLLAAQIVARDAGTLAFGYFRNRESLAIESKGLQDVVSKADREVETLINERLLGLFPGDGMLGEEHGVTGGGTGIWVVDPIDGTSCFLDGIPAWCISIAYVREGEIQVGVIYDPNHDELFVAARGQGARLNGVPMRVAPATSFTDGAMGIGCTARTPAKVAGALIERLLENGGLFYRNGSGALCLAYVAAGRLIGYVEPHIHPWDCLAGLLLIEEAGGWCENYLTGEWLTKGNRLVAGPKALELALLDLASLM